MGMRVGGPKLSLIMCHITGLNHLQKIVAGLWKSNFRREAVIAKNSATHVLCPHIIHVCHVGHEIENNIHFFVIVEEAKVLLQHLIVNGVIFQCDTGINVPTPNSRVALIQGGIVGREPWWSWVNCRGGRIAICAYAVAIR